MNNRMEKFSQIVKWYKYIDPRTWKIASQVDLNPNELTSILTTDLEKDKQVQLGLSVLAFHYIWNHEHAQLAQQILKQLLKSGEEIFHPFFYFLKSKACHFKGEYDLSLAFLNKAEESLQSSINRNFDYRQLLTCIGSLNDKDPEGIEYTVMKAIISNDKGNNYYAIGLYDEAINAFTCALNLQIEAYSTMCHANIAYTRRCMGKSFEEKGMRLEAIEQYDLAASIANDIYDECHPEAIAIKKALDHCHLQDSESEIRPSNSNAQLRR